MARKVSLSVIIVTYQSNNVVVECLNSINKFNDIGDALEVIVVDNYPYGNDSFAYLGLEFPWMRSIRNPENRGFGHANNEGVRIAQGEYILFLNPDTEIVEHIFGYAVRQFENNPELNVFGMLLYDRNGKICSNSFAIMPEHRGFLPSTIWVPIYKYCHYTPQHIFPLGADLFIRKSSFMEAGGFDENMFLCYEEPDLVRRILGSQQVKIFNKKIIHLGGHAIDSLATERFITSFIDSEQYYFKKHKLDYSSYARYVLARLRIKNIVKRFIGKIVSHADILFMDHYRRIANGANGK